MTATGDGIQSHLSIAFPIKSPADAKALADNLLALMPDFAKAQDAVGTVHYSRFTILPNNTLMFVADIDGEIDALIGSLATSSGPLFDAIFERVDNPPPTPVANNSEKFLDWAKQHQINPLIAYSACGNASVQTIKASAAAAGFKGSAEQHPLLNYLPIQSTLKAFALEQVVLRATQSKMGSGADSVGTLHFAHFVPLPDNHLGFFTIFDGSFQQYIQDFTDKIGPVFDTLFDFVIDPPPTPVAKNAQAFYQWEVANNLPPIGLYSAYPGLTVQDIKALLADSKATAPRP
jgi:hypothetical protein